MRFVSTLLQAVLGFAIITLAWGIGGSLAQASRASPQFFPGPEAVANKVMELIAAESFQQHLWASLTVLLYGLVPALLLGVVIGAAAGSSSLARWLFGPLVVTIAAAPVVALLPMLVLWLGLTMMPKIVLVFLAALFTAANTVLVRWPKRRAQRGDPDGFDEPPAARERAPGRASAIFAGLRVGVLLGVSALVVAELIASNTGLGYFIAMSGAMFNTAEAMAAVLLIAVPTAAVGVFLQAIEEQLAA
jgi:ABC-type nitrate/sulfonate/bicarbonate transport system permease component